MRGEFAKQRNTLHRLQLQGEDMQAALLQLASEVLLDRQLAQGSTAVAAPAWQQLQEKDMLRYSEKLMREVGPAGEVLRCAYSSSASYARRHLTTQPVLANFSFPALVQAFWQFDSALREANASRQADTGLTDPIFISGTWSWVMLLAVRFRSVFAFIACA